MNNLFNTYQILGCISIIVFGAVALIASIGWLICEKEYQKELCRTRIFKAENKKQKTKLEAALAKNSFLDNRIRELEEENSLQKEKTKKALVAVRASVNDCNEEAKNG